MDRRRILELTSVALAGSPALPTVAGGFASFTAIGPPEWTHGARPGEVAEAPLPCNERRLVINEATGVRERTRACDKPRGKPSFN
jgi:hypothetical protein